MRFDPIISSFKLHVAEGTLKYDIPFTLVSNLIHFDNILPQWGGVIKRRL
ncbi:hypothetical protein AXF42_Ash020852 [Apostasia shenzhenica]|uniref:Uncharacterized protein n=1 Tax=Apostasia shenzhenica TaxID=1088818 RepID=A0A2H9ZSS4_9ASPA|nr:hypothetical protein AXF42_Ash020852 [Apostasia shenzhenica]